MDFLEGPEARERAQSIASVITSTMEGKYCTPLYEYPILFTSLVFKTYINSIFDKSF